MPPVSRDLSPPGASVESLRRSIEALVAVRQALRASGATRSELEANRQAIVRRQQEFSAALISQQWDIAAARLVAQAA